MSFYEFIKKYKDFDFTRTLNKVTTADVFKAINSENLSENDLLALLSPQASEHLEDMAIKARELTLRNFGKVVYIYAPMYVANVCENECIYCGFKHSNQIKRRQLSIPEVRKEAEVVSAMGIKHILILTGESRKVSTVSYIKECVRELKKYFSSISIEIYPLESGEYAELINAGVDGITIYQETYDEVIYSKLHLKGQKTNFRFRLETPDRACKSRIRSVTVGALLGLSEPRKECFMTLMHALYLQRNFPDIEIGISFPRIQPQTGGFKPSYIVTDRDLVQFVLAARLFIPKIGINMSTREKNEFRMNLIGIGVTRVSAGSNTEVGGYSSGKKSEGQFDVADTTGVQEMKELICAKGYLPVMKDWDHY